LEYHKACNIPICKPSPPPEGPLFCVRGRCQRGEATPLRVTLTSDRSTYVVTDPIVLQLAVTNVSNERVQVADLRQISPETIFASWVITLNLADADDRSERLNHHCGAQEDYSPGDKTRWLAPRETMPFAFWLN